MPPLAKETASSQPIITVIVCVLNGEKHLPELKASLNKQSFDSKKVRYLLVDNGSKDRTVALAGSLGFEVVRCRKRGVTHARQKGWKKAKTRYIAFIDVDCRPPESWLESAVDQLEGKNHTGAVGFRLTSPTPTTLAEKHIVQEGLLETDHFWKGNALSFPFLVTAGMVVRRDVLMAIGGFDESLGECGGEDADLCWRIERAGWELVYLQDNPITHLHRSTILGMLKQAHWYGRGSTALFARWRKDLGWPRYTDWNVYMRILNSALRLVPGLILGETPEWKYRHLLRFLDALAFLAGKWREVPRQRVLFL